MSHRIVLAVLLVVTAGCAPALKDVKPSLAADDSGTICPFPSPAEITACLGKGATIGWNPEATAQARSTVRAQVTELLK